MTLSPGRNSLLENIYRSIIGFIRTTIVGSQRPINVSTATARIPDYDLEIQEFPIRDRKFATLLIEMCDKCPEIGVAVDTIIGDLLSSADGDDQGFLIADDLKDGSPVNPKVKGICDALIERVIGGLTLEPVFERAIKSGNAFSSIGIAEYKFGLGISKLLTLPTWEIFRKEDDQGNVIRFEQRRSLNDRSPITFHPSQIVHWRFRRNNLYGRSLFHESVDDWIELKKATEDFAAARRALGINPNVHTMPPGVDERYKRAYQQDYEARLHDGIITDFYLSQGADVKKLGGGSTDLKTLQDAVMFYRQKIAMRSRLPAWLFVGFPTEGATDIAGQPALAFARHINKIRMCFAVGLKQLFDTELALRGIPPEERLYRIIFPKIHVDPQAEERGGGTAAEMEGDRNPPIDIVPLIENWMLKRNETIAPPKKCLTGDIPRDDQKNCKNSKACGNTCINLTYHCWDDNPLSEAGKTKVKQLKDKLDKTEVTVPALEDISKDPTAKKIGDGAFGVVYAKDGVAYKYAKPGQGSISDEEIELQTQVGLAGIAPRVLGRRGNGGYAQEYLDGYVTMNSFLKTNTDMNQKRIMFSNQLENLKKMHDLGIAHRDFHTGNYLVNEDGQGKFLDFGLSQRLKVDKLSDLSDFAFYLRHEYANNLPSISEYTRQRLKVSSEELSEAHLMVKRGEASEDDIDEIYNDYYNLFRQVLK